MAGKLLLVLPEGLCSPKHGPPQGYLSIFKTWQLAFPRERKESKLIMRHMKHISNFYSDSCTSVYPCCRHKTCDLQSIKFYYTGTTMPNDSTHVYPPKKDKQPVAYRGKKKTSMKLWYLITNHHTAMQIHWTYACLLYCESLRCTTGLSTANSRGVANLYFGMASREWGHI